MPPMTIGALVTVPELQAEGLARQVATRGGYTVIRFLTSGAEMTQEANRVLRYCLMPGTRVRFARAGAEVEGVITAARMGRDAASGLLVYRVKVGDEAADQPLREDAVVGVPACRDPLERLLTVQFNDLRPMFAKAGSALPSEPWGAATLAAREELLAWRDRAWDQTSGVIGLAAARIHALPHQMLVAQRVLADRQVRFLLADEVGLGKTIEAGLIIQSLLALKPDLRVLVIVPGALLSQWFLELYVRFGGQQYLMLDHERLRSYEGNPWVGEQFVLASARAVEELAGKDALRLATSKWDMVVVDECHRMQPGGVLYKRVAVLSKATPHVLLLSATPARQHPDAYLALLALLQPQVWRMDDLKAFTGRLAAHEHVATLLARTIVAPVEELPALAAAWPLAAPGDALLADLAATLTAKPQNLAAREALVDHVREHLQLDRRVVRNRRQVLARLATATGIAAFAPTSRSRETVLYPVDAAEAAVRTAAAAYRAALVAGRDTVPPRLAHWLLQVELALAAHPVVLDRMLAMRAAVLDDPAGVAEYRARARADETLAQVLRSDLSENEINSHIAISAACHAEPAREAAVLAALRTAATAWNRACSKKPTARLTALVKRLQAFWAESPAEKALVFTTHNLAVGPLAAALRLALGETTVETFGAHQDTAEREEAAGRFRTDDKCAVLVCDPLGGEGRNFQFVSVVVHHDLPWSLAAVEQRIGRVDRLGRDGDIPSWLLAPKDPLAVDAAWGELLDAAVGVFSASSSGLEFVADEVESLALAAALQGGGVAVRQVIPAAVALVAQERDARGNEVDDAFATAAAGYAAAGIASRAVGAARAPAGSVARWVRGLGGEARRDEEYPQPWKLRTTYHTEPLQGVYDREAALAHPQHQFLGIGHRLIDRLVDDAARAAWCCAAAWRRTRPNDVPTWKGLRAVYVLTPEYAALAMAGLRLEVLRRLFLAGSPCRVTIAVSDEGSVVTEPALLAVVTPPFSAKAGDAALSGGTNREAWTRPMLAGDSAKVTAWQAEVRRAAVGAEAHVATLVEGERASLRARLDARLAPGLAAAQATAASALARFGADHADTRQTAAEAADELKQITALRAAVDGATFTLETVAWVVV